LPAAGLVQSLGDTPGSLGYSDGLTIGTCRQRPPDFSALFIYYYRQSFRPTSVYATK
jgi:hypothetical protein